MVFGWQINLQGFASKEILEGLLVVDLGYQLQSRLLLPDRLECRSSWTSIAACCSSNGFNIFRYGRTLGGCHRVGYTSLVNEDSVATITGAAFATFQAFLTVWPLQITLRWISRPPLQVDLDRQTLSFRDRQVLQPLDLPATPTILDRIAAVSPGDSDPPNDAIFKPRLSVWSSRV